MENTLNHLKAIAKDFSNGVISSQKVEQDLELVKSKTYELTGHRLTFKVIGAEYNLILAKDPITAIVTSGVTKILKKDQRSLEKFTVDFCNREYSHNTFIDIGIPVYVSAEIVYLTKQYKVLYIKELQSFYSILMK